MKQLLLPMKKVKKSNAICRAYWTPLNVYEPRIIALLASQIQLEDEDFKEYEIPFTALFGDAVHGTDNYNTIRKTLKSLVEKSITIKEDDGSLVIYPIFYKVRITPNKNSFTIAIHNELKYHFLDLKFYTQYNLMEFLTLSSTYSQRLFEYLKSWDDCESTQIAVEELHKILGVPEEYRKNFFNFKRRALEPALKEINKKTGLEYSWEVKKQQGRKITHILFINSKLKKKTPNWIKDKIQKAKEVQNNNVEPRPIKRINEPEQASFEELLKQMEAEKKRLVEEAKRNKSK